MPPHAASLLILLLFSGAIVFGMATSGFPPTNNLPLQPTTSGSLLAQNGSVGSTILFTARQAGLYEINVQVHLTATNNVGTLSVVFACPTIGTFLTLAPNIGTGKDAVSPGQVAFMNLGDTITMVATATGLTGTTYNTFVNVGQLF